MQQNASLAAGSARRTSSRMTGGRSEQAGHRDRQQQSAKPVPTAAAAAAVAASVGAIDSSYRDTIEDPSLPQPPLPQPGSPRPAPCMSVFSVRWASEEVRSIFLKKIRKMPLCMFDVVRAGSIYISIYIYLGTKGRYRYRIASKLMIGEIPARKLSSSSHKFG